MTIEAGDRRAATKARYRRAILDAAGDLITEREGPRFSADELAERADVSRRTVFNHFASVGDVVLAVATEKLGQIVDEFFAASAATPVGTGTRAEMFDEIEQILRATDLPGAIAALYQALGIEDGHDDERGARFGLIAFSRVAQHLSGELARRNASADPLDIEMLVTSLFHGVEVIAHHWISTTDDPTGAEGRAAFGRLLDRLVDSVRVGYMPER